MAWSISSSVTTPSSSSTGLITGSYKIDAEVAVFWVDGAGVGWPAQKAFCPVACVAPMSSAMSSNSGNPFLRKGLAMV